MPIIKNKLSAMPLWHRAAYSLCMDSPSKQPTEPASGKL